MGVWMAVHTRSDGEEGRGFRRSRKDPDPLPLLLPLPLPLPLILPLTFGAPPERRGRRIRPRRGAAHGCAAFSAEAGCVLGKSRRLRRPGAQHRARRRGVLSLRQVSLHKQRKVARAVTARKPLNLPWLSPLPSKERSRTARCARPSSALRAPSPASERRVEAVPGAQAGCAFVAPGFLAQAKKGGSRRYGAKALDLDVGVPGQQAGQDPPYEAAVAVTAGRARAARCARTLI